jgi:hypothetical protein
VGVAEWERLCEGGHDSEPATAGELELEAASASILTSLYDWSFLVVGQKNQNGKGYTDLIKDNLPGLVLLFLRSVFPDPFKVN